VILVFEGLGFVLDRRFAPRAALRENYSLRFIKPPRLRES
jgi:hypothetical protein